MVYCHLIQYAGMSRISWLYPTANFSYCLFEHSERWIELDFSSQLPFLSSVQLFINWMNAVSHCVKYPTPVARGVGPVGNPPCPAKIRPGPLFMVHIFVS